MFNFTFYFSGTLSGGLKLVKDCGYAVIETRQIILL